MIEDPPLWVLPVGFLVYLIGCAASAGLFSRFGMLSKCSTEREANALLVVFWPISVPITLLWKLLVLIYELISGKKVED